MRTLFIIRYLLRASKFYSHSIKIRIVLLVVLELIDVLCNALFTFDLHEQLQIRDCSDANFVIKIYIRERFGLFMGLVTVSHPIIY